MPHRDALALNLDHAHCRAICDEIGERLRHAIKMDDEIPQRFVVLLSRLAELERAPSIVPSMDEIINGTPEHMVRLCRQMIREMPPIGNQFLPVLEPV
jgi:hypothetical protein